MTKVILAAPSEETSERGVRNEPFIYYLRSAGGRAFEKPLTLFEEYGFRPVSTVIQDDRLRWVHAPCIRDGWLYPPEAQIDRIGQFHQGHSQVAWPLHIYRLKLSEKPWHPCEVIGEEAAGLRRANTTGKRWQYGLLIRLAEVEVTRCGKLLF